MGKIKVGIIGVGNISNVHIAGYLAREDVELYAFCDINEKRLIEKGEKYGVTRLFTDYNEMLKLEEIDAVSVCTWNCVHAAASIAALKAGKNVLCEKPMAMNAEQAFEMEKAAKESGKLLQIGFVRRFGNDAEILKKYIDNDELGEIYFAKATYLRRHGTPGGWFVDKEKSGGGPLIDLGVHVIDLTRYLMGNPKPVSVYGATFNKLGARSDLEKVTSYTSAEEKTEIVSDVEEAAVAMIRYDNGAVLLIETSFELNLEKEEGKIEFFGTKAGASVNPQVKIFSDEHGRLTNISFNGDTSLSFECLFENEVSHFVNCVKTGCPTIAPASDGVEVMHILDAIYESAKNGHEVLI